MAETVSPAAGRRHGVARVCRVRGVPRSSVSAARAAIRADLARLPWSGEGHRKVWARLRVLDGVRVARKRVLQLMRGCALLSPPRVRPRPAEAHDRRIITDAPNRAPPAVP